MFPLYDTTRRRICIAAFLLLCLAPTLYVAAWCIAWQLPGHLRAETRRLNQQLGLDVALDGLRHPRPGTVLYEGLKLSDPETGQSVLRCRALEAVWTTTTDEQNRQRPAIVMSLSQPEIETVSLDRLWQLLQRVLQGQNGGPEIEWRATASQLTLRAGEDSQTLTDFEGAIGALSGGVQAEAAFRLAGSGPSEPARVRIVRNRQLTPPADGCELDTGGSELPCSLLAIGLPELRSLGASSRFCGYCCVNQVSSGWQGELAGQLLEIDLGGLVSDQFPHKLSGTAHATIQHARFHRGRLEEASGTLIAGPGVVGRSLIEAAASYLKLARAPLAAPPGDLLPYEQLALDFSVDARGLGLRGRCRPAESGTILHDSRRDH